MGKEETLRVLQVANFPDSLKRELKIIAAVDGKTLKDVIIEALTGYVERTKKGKR